MLWTLSRDLPTPDVTAVSADCAPDSAEEKYVAFLDVLDRDAHDSIRTIEWCWRNQPSDFAVDRQPECLDASQGRAHRSLPGERLDRQAQIQSEVSGSQRRCRLAEARWLKQGGKAVDEC